MLGGLSFLNNQLTGAGVPQPQQASMADIASALAGFSQVFAAGSNNPAMQALSQLALQRSQDMLALEYEQQLLEDPKVPPPPNLDPARAAAVTSRVAQRRMIELEERTQLRADKQLEQQKDQFNKQMEMSKEQFSEQMKINKQQFSDELAVRKQQADADSLTAQASFNRSIATEAAEQVPAEEKLATVDALLEDYFGDPAAIVDPTIRTERQAMKSQLLQALDGGASPGQLMQTMEDFWGLSYTNTYMEIAAGLEEGQTIDPAAVSQTHEAMLVARGILQAPENPKASKMDPRTGLMPGEVGLAGVAMKTQPPIQNPSRSMRDFYADTPLNAATPMQFKASDLGGTINPATFRPRPFAEPQQANPFDFLNSIKRPANPETSDLNWLQLLGK